MRTYLVHYTIVQYLGHVFRGTCEVEAEPVPAAIEQAAEDWAAAFDPHMNDPRPTLSVDHFEEIE